MIEHREAGSAKAVLFDLDGTLLDTAPDFVTALNYMLTQHTMPQLQPATIRAGVTNGSAGLITMAFDKTANEEGFEELRQEFLGYYFDRLTDNTRLFPGMEEVLSRLTTKGIPWGIVTNKPAKYTNAILEKLWLPSAPGSVICPDHVSKTKPDPESVLLACEQLAIAPQDTVFVGDHLRDIQAGLNAGCVTVSAAYGYIDSSENPEDWGGHYLINHASELNPIIFQTR